MSPVNMETANQTLGLSASIGDQLTGPLVGDEAEVESR